MAKDKKEAQARIKINKLLERSGWRFDDSDAGRHNIRLEEKTELGDDYEETKNGFIDYLLLDKNQHPICVLEAKRESLEPLVGKEQARKYANSEGCPFVILSNGISHYFWDIKHDDPQHITEFPTPLSLQERVKCHQNPQELSHEEVTEHYIKIKNRPLRDYQVAAIHAIQQAAKKGKTRFLLEMATGTGKTAIAAALCKLFLSTGQAHRILFLVDRIELENQAEKDFQKIFKDLRNVCKYKSGKWRSGQIVVSTVQSLLAENRYRKDFSPTDFNLVISDEAHRSLGGKSRAVFEYFLGYKLGLTATPKDYLKGADKKGLPLKNPKEWERRNLMDTYKTFGCKDGEPTFRYKLTQGVQEGFLIKPRVLDARTDITTQLLSDEGYAITLPTDNEEEAETVVYGAKDFETKFFNDNTNRVLCETIIRRGLKDPITNEMGKTLVFCVRCNHAARITNLLNQCAREMFPGKYKESNFAVQITSDIPDAQKFAKDFANNKLYGRSQFSEKTHPDYDTSKTRVCVTVGMMTTGYDCPDLLNIAMLRPIFSPSDFIQMKGRGTRKHLFEYQEDSSQNTQKIEFLLFDFFANYEYFETGFKYDEQLILPKLQPSSKEEPNAPFIGGDDDNAPAPAPDIVDKTPDEIRTESFIKIGDEGMKIDRALPLHEQFEDVIRNSKTINDIFKEQDLEGVLEFIKTNVFHQPTEHWTAADIRKSYEQEYDIGRKISLSEMLLMAFEKIAEFKTRTERINEEFQKFRDIQKLDIPVEQVPILKKFFEDYLSSQRFRGIIYSEKYGELIGYPSFSIEELQEIKTFFKDTAEYINEYLQLEIAELDWQIDAA